MNDNIKIKINENTKHEINLVGQFCGEDLNISIFGGDKGHIGAVALAVASVEGYQRKYSPTVSSLSVLDHKDDEVARFVAKEVASFLNKQVVVAAGIHIDNATLDDLKIVMENVKNVTEKLKMSLEERLNS